jgi:hypothetical protein
MLKKTSNMSKADREIFGTKNSAKNDCLYFVAAHGALVRIYAKKLADGGSGSGE